MVENGANRSQGNATPVEIRFVPGNQAHAMPSRYGLAGEGREEEGMAMDGDGLRGEVCHAVVIWETTFPGQPDNELGGR